MRNCDLWGPTKYEFRNGKLRASCNEKYCMVSSRLVSDYVAGYYEELIPKYCRGKLLDLGCGKAPLYMLYRKYVTDTICVDWENTEHGNTFCDYIYDLSKELPLKEEYDTIILSDVLEHIQDPGLLMKEMFRVLKPSGHVILNVPFLYWIHESPYDYYRYTEYLLRYLAESVGFRLVILRPYGGAMAVIGDIVGKNLINIPYGGKYFSLMVQYVSWACCSIMEKISIRLASTNMKSFPLGYFMVLIKE